MRYRVFCVLFGVMKQRTEQPVADDVPLGPGLRKEQAKAIYQMGKEAVSWSNKEAKRLIKRLNRHQDELLTFLHHVNVPFENNFGERSIRGAVIMRKNSFNNRSEKGALTQSVLMIQLNNAD